MKRFLTLIVLAMIVFAVVYRQRLYLRDPLATVTRNGVKLGGVTVMINYSNDVLMFDRSAATERLYLVQHWSNVAGVPTALLKCVNGMACMTDADHASVSALPGRRTGLRETTPAVTMTNKEADFVDEDGTMVKVTLR